MTAPRSGVGARYRYWSSVRDLIKELQVLGWTQSGIPAPSVKSAVDSHRNRRYPLTEEGQRRRQRHRPAGLVRRAHDGRAGGPPVPRGLLLALAEGSLFCPEVPQKEVGEKHGAAHWAEYAADLLGRSDSLVEVELEELERHLKRALRRRFGSRSTQGLEITSKELTEATNDALADYALSARGLRFGATTLDALKSWGMDSACSTRAVTSPATRAAI